MRKWTRSELNENGADDIKETEKFYSGYGVGYRMDYGLVGVENLRSRALIVSLSGAFPPPILHTHAALLHYQQFTPAPPVPVPP